MRTKQISAFLPGLTILLLALASSARADILTPLQSRFVPLTDTDWATVNGYDFTTLKQQPFDKFDPKLGTLKDVILNIYWRVDSEIGMTFVTPSTISVQSSGSLGWNRPGGAALFIKFPLFTHNESFTSNTSQTKTFTQTSFGNSGPIVLTSASDLALFTGPGPISLPVGANAFSNFSTTSGNGFGEAHTQVAVIMTLQFEFIPELSSLTSLALGGACLLIFLPFRRTFRPA
jgi:hypothetical protein